MFAEIRGKAAARNKKKSAEAEGPTNIKKGLNDSYFFITLFCIHLQGPPFIA